MALTIDELPVAQLENHIRKSGLLDGFTFEGVDYPALNVQNEFFQEDLMNQNKEDRFLTIMTGGDQSSFPSFEAERQMTIIATSLPGGDKYEAVVIRAFTEQLNNWLRTNVDGTDCIHKLTVLDGTNGPYEQDTGRFNYEINMLVGFSLP